MKCANRRGALVVEAALVLPLLLLILLGLIEYGWAFLKSQQVANAARQGARLGVVSEGTAADVTAAVLAAMTASEMNTSGYTVTMVPSDPMSLTPGQSLSVTVSVPYTNIDLVNSSLIPVPTNLSSTVVMAREGP